MPENRQRNESDSTSELSEFIAEHTDESAEEIDSDEPTFVPPWHSSVEEIDPENE